MPTPFLRLHDGHSQHPHSSPSHEALQQTPGAPQACSRYDRNTVTTNESRVHGQKTATNTHKPNPTPSLTITWPRTYSKRHRRNTDNGMPKPPALHPMTGDPSVKTTVTSILPILPSGQPPRGNALNKAPSCLCQTRPGNGRKSLSLTRPSSPTPTRPTDAHQATRQGAMGSKCPLRPTCQTLHHHSPPPGHGHTTCDTDERPTAASKELAGCSEHHHHW